MSDTFANAVALASKLSEKDQEALGAILLEEMRSEKRWAEAFANSQDQLSRQADDALAEHRAGKTKNWH